ncbi:heterokaryon incompatibility protein-domain-containing protein [Lasiosphaeria ovina]|uniref:Heterokaryon incompatibility protein-domain-containing protein n=1 Tax=Lasiosphaeria ovina TaxID=92902 RepID=A0AAE0KCM1_9PEZI|nr:heterokaryon incompatibility protein-domain-containing protein [Lasiosphaeria ovina]
MEKLRNRLQRGTIYVRLFGWVYWKLAIPVPLTQTIRDRFARRAEERVLRTSQPVPYKYHALGGPRAIRLLKIDKLEHAGIWRPGVVRCTVHEFPIAGAPPFNALSYTWKEDEVILDTVRDARYLIHPLVRLYGSKWWKALVNRSECAPARLPWLDEAVRRATTATVQSPHQALDGLPRRLILCDGQAMFVTQNLHNALSTVSRKNPGYWWIDQLCINQEDAQEKSVQVALMGELYRTASTVAIWLGARTSFEARIVPALELLANMPDDDVEAIAVSSLSLFYRAFPKLFALVGFFSRAWFDRLWIVQEFAVARHAAFLLGDADIPLALATRALRRIEQVLSASSLGIFLNSADMPTENRSGLLDSRDYTAAHGPWTLEKWLGVARGRKTTDPRDYVFGGLSLLGRDADPAVRDIEHQPVLVTRSDATALGADYTKPVEAVYFAFAVALFQSELGINALSLVGTRKDAKRYPTWMVNLHEPLSPKPLHQLQVRQPRRVRSPGHRPTETEMYVGGECVFADAVHFDEIAAVGDPLTHWLSGGPDAPFHLADTFRLTLELGPRYPPTGELLLTALWRTLILEEESASPSLDASFADAVRWYFDLSRAGIATQDARTDWASKDDEDAYREARSLHERLGASLMSMLSREEYASTEFAGLRLPPAASATTKGKPDATTSDKGLNDPALWYGSWLAFFEAFHEATPGRRLFVTRRGFLGMGPATAQPGDDVLFLRGAWAPYVFRSVDLADVPGWQPGSELADLPPPRILVGEAYVHGVMGQLAGSDAELVAAADKDVFTPIMIV